MKFSVKKIVIFFLFWKKKIQKIEKNLKQNRFLWFLHFSWFLLFYIKRILTKKWKLKISKENLEKFSFKPGRAPSADSKLHHLTLTTISCWFEYFCQISWFYHISWSDQLISWSDQYQNYQNYLHILKILS